MIASAGNLDSLAQSIVLDFQRNESAPFPMTDIDRMASDYLHLQVQYMPLSDDRSLLGLTAYEETKVNVTVDGREETLRLERDTVLLDRHFISPWPKAVVKQRLARQRRFTLAHECAHQILFRLEPENVKRSLRRQYSEFRQYSCHDLKTKEDWNEWQANTLGAALLMPRVHIFKYFEQYQNKVPLASYGGKFPMRERLALSHLTGLFGVSVRAVEIRLKELNLLTELPVWLYHDPSDIEGDYTE